MLGLTDSGDYDHLPAEGAGAEDRALLARLYEVLDTIPVDSRIAWALRHIEGEKLEAVAELTGCSLATAKRRISAAQQIIDGAFGQ